MPTYQYKCKECGLEFEIRRPMEDSDKPVPFTCCGPIKRVYGMPTIHTKKMAGTLNGEDYRITNEPPDELKPDTWQFDLDEKFGLKSYPNSPATRTGPNRIGGQ